jgi:hypothetical protein
MAALIADPRQLEITGKQDRINQDHGWQYGPDEENHKTERRAQQHLAGIQGEDVLV